MSRVYNSYTAARSKYSIEDIPMPDSLEGVFKSPELWNAFIASTPALGCVWWFRCLCCYGDYGGIHYGWLSIRFIPGGLSNIPMPTASG